MPGPTGQLEVGGNGSGHAPIEQTDASISWGGHILIQDGWEGVRVL